MSDDFETREPSQTEVEEHHEAGSPVSSEPQTLSPEQEQEEQQQHNLSAEEEEYKLPKSENDSFNESDIKNEDAKALADDDFMVVTKESKETGIFFLFNKFLSLIPHHNSLSRHFIFHYSNETRDRNICKIISQKVTQRISLQLEQ